MTAQIHDCLPSGAYAGFEVQRYQGHVYVAQQRGGWPEPRPGYVLVRLIACGICGADVRVQTGNKAVMADDTRPLVAGHEGVGVVAAVGDRVSAFKRGDVVVLLPHQYPAKHATKCPTPAGGPRCIGQGCTRHLGFDVDGVFADRTLVPATNLVRVPTVPLQHATELASSLPRGALFALVEPMLCVLSGYRMLGWAAQTLYQRALRPGRALVIGCGPMGFLNALMLLERGWQVALVDTVSQRAALARWCLGNRVSLCDLAPRSACRAGGFDLAMVTASSASAIRMGEHLVRDGGLVYLFAGLNAAERTAMDEREVFVYERVHRAALALVMTTSQGDHDKVIGYVGHSGYWDDLAPQAIAMVAVHAAQLERAVTGVIRGWTSSRIEAQLPGGSDWSTQDNSPAILAVLNGAELRSQHLKLLVLPGAQGKTARRAPQGRPRRVTVDQVPAVPRAEASRGRILRLVPVQRGQQRP